MKLYLIQQITYTEGNYGDLQFSNLRTIGIFDSEEKVKEIQDSFTPVTFIAQFGSAPQNLVVTEIELNTKVNDFCDFDGICDFLEEIEEEDY